MRTESKKSYSAGFFVAETELRRIVDTLLTQFEKAPCSMVPRTFIEIIFRNGAISETSKLDDVVQLENGGSVSIEKLTIRMYPEEKTTEGYAAEVTFAKPQDEREKSVKYMLHGLDRDWVFVTSSLLEERLSRVKRVAFGHFIFSRTLLPLLLLLTMLVTMLLTTVREVNSENREKRLFADSVHAEWRRGAFKDPIQTIVRIEEIRANSEHGVSPSFMIIPLVAPVLVVIVLFGIAKARPWHTFYWGESANNYDRHIRIANFVGVIVIMGVIISVVGEVVANWFTRG